MISKIFIRIGAATIGFFVGISIGTVIILAIRIGEHLVKIFDLLP